MEEAQKMGLTNVWLEYDFALVCVVFTVRTNVPWMLHNQWNTCLSYCGKIRFRVTHIFREGNACADKLVNLGFIHRESFHWCSRRLTVSPVDLRLNVSSWIYLFWNHVSLLR